MKIGPTIGAAIEPIVCTARNTDTNNTHSDIFSNMCYFRFFAIAARWLTCVRVGVSETWTLFRKHEKAWEVVYQQNGPQIKYWTFLLN